MPDSIVLLEERKEVTTFLLDEGTITATTVTTPTGETQVMSMQEIKSRSMTLSHYQLIQTSENLQLKNILQLKAKSSWALQSTIRSP